MTLTLNNTNTLTADSIIVSGTNLSDVYATINYSNMNSGSVSQQDVDDSLAPLISKDIAYNSTLQSHISLVDTNTTDTTTHTNDIAVLNTQHIQNFAGLNEKTPIEQTIITLILNWQPIFTTKRKLIQH